MEPVPSQPLSLSSPIGILSKVTYSKSRAIKIKVQRERARLPIPFYVATVTPAGPR